MNFDNAAFKHRMPQQKTAPGYEKLPMKRGIFFDMFPFSVIFRRDMTMYRIGDGLKEVFSDLQGKKVNEEFTLVRPMLEFSWDNVSRSGSHVCFRCVDTFISIMQNVPKGHLVIYELLLSGVYTNSGGSAMKDTITGPFKTFKTMHF